MTTRPELRLVSTCWTFDAVEERLREAMTTLRRIPFPRNGRPMADRSHWPEIVREFWEQYGASDPGTSPVELADIHTELDRDRNRVRIVPSPVSIHRMDECLAWVYWIESARNRKILTLRLCGRSWRRIAQRDGWSHTYIKIIYDRCIQEICDRLNGLAK